MKRCFDLILGIILIMLLLIPMIAIALAVKLSSKGPVLFWSDRIGKDNIIFKMPKFRTMRVETPNVATHLLDDPGFYRTSIGLFLRKTSLDELPQLYSIMLGDMSFVGPRPALYNQDDLIKLRTNYGIHDLTPGLTGWAQINGRDELPISRKVEYDLFYLHNRSLLFDLKIVWMTIKKVILKEGVTH